MNNFINKAPYLRTSREFPEDLVQLCLEVNKSYVDIAGAVNNRTISIFPTSRPAITGETWYIAKNQRQQSLRQIYPFSSFTSPMNIPHGIITSGIFSFSKIYGTAYDGTYWYTLPYVDVVDATNQIIVIVSSTDIIITAGAGSPPAIMSGIIVLEWLSQV
jgi:hypothetical protein